MTDRSNPGAVSLVFCSVDHRRTGHSNDNMHDSVMVISELDKMMLLGSLVV